MRSTTASSPQRADPTLEGAFPDRLARALATSRHAAVLERSARLDAASLYRRSLEVGHGLKARGVQAGTAITIPDRPSLDCLVAELAARLADAVVEMSAPSPDGLSFAGPPGGLALYAPAEAAVPLDLLAARGIAWAASNRLAPQPPGTLGRSPDSATSAKRVLVLAPATSLALRAARDEVLLNGGTICFADAGAGAGIEAAATRFAAISALATTEQILALAEAIARRADDGAGWRALLRAHPIVARRIARGALPRGFRTVSADAPPDTATRATLAQAGIAFTLVRAVS